MKTASPLRNFIPPQFLRKIFLALLALGLSATASFAQVTVFATAGTTGPTPYTALNLAFTAINNGTHQGAISINISGNTTETASASLNNSGAGLASYTSVSVTPSAPAVISGSIVGAIIKLNGADNVTIDGRIGGTGRNLSVSNTSTATATAGVWLASVAAGNGASNNVVRNLEIACGAIQSTGTNSTFGIIMSGTTISVTANGDDNDNNSFVANRIIRVRYGIVTRGTTTNLNMNPVVTDNVIGPAAFGTDQIGRDGIFMQADTGATVSRNTVQTVGTLITQTPGFADHCGICIGTDTWGTTDTATLTSNNYTVTRNVINNIIEEKTGSAIGIKLGTTAGGSATNNIVANNFILNVRANGTSGDQVCGIGIAGGNGDKVVFNSISLTGDQDPAGAVLSTTYGNAIRIPGANGTNNANLTLADNSIYLDANSSTAAQRYYTITANSAAYSFGTGFENYNNLYINPSNTQLRTGGFATTGTGSAATTEFATLANFQAAYTVPQDANSIQANPLYFSITGDLHIPTNSPNADVGMVIAGVADDIDGQTRPIGAGVDIGADEATPSPGTLQFSSATYSATELAGTTTIMVTRAGGSNGAVSVDYATTDGTATGGASCGGSIDYLAASGTLNWADGDGTPKSFSVPVCNDGFNEPNETVNLTLSNPTGGATLGTPSAAVLTIFNSDTFNGSVNVGTGQTYTSLTNPGGLFDAINNGVVTGNTIANITSDLTAETGAISLNQFAMGFTLTIQPSGGSTRVVSGSNATVLINLNGADDVTFTGLNTGGNALLVRNTNVTSGSVFRMINDASSNSLLGMTIEAGNGSTQVILSTGTTTGNDNNTISSNNIRDRSDIAGVAFNGIASAGTVGAAANSNISIISNQITNFVQAGILVLTGSEGINVTGNDISSTATRTTTQFGINVSSSLGTNTVSQNSIHGLRTTFAGGTGISTVGMFFGDARATTISRNRIYDFPAAAAGTGRIVGIESDGSSSGAANLKIVNNMISLSTSVVTAQNVMGLFDFGFGGNTFAADFNSIYIGGAASGASPSWAIVRGVGTPTAFAARDNIAFNNRTGGTGNHFAIGDESPNTGTFVSNYNFFAGTGVTPANFFEYGTTAVNFATWQAGPPTRDANSIAGVASSFTISSIFVNAPGGDLHLLPTATQVIAAGNAAGTAVTVDFDGETRSATPEIGADEVAAAGSIQFSSPTYIVGENGPSVTLTVTRTGGADGAVGASYTTADGTAVAPGDYSSQSGTVAFADGDPTSQTIVIPIVDDALFEAAEDFSVVLSAPTGGATLGSPSTATVTITDNDSAPTVQFSMANYSENENGDGTATLTVTLSAPSGLAASVDYSTTDGTATSPADYNAVTNGTVNFAPGDTSADIQITINDDTTFEGNEDFTVTLSNPMGATLGSPSTATVTINDDDSLPLVQFSASNYDVGEGAGMVTVTVTKTGNTTLPASVSYATSDGSATGGADYTPQSGMVTFAPGETSQSFDVPITQDTTFEGDENFIVTLTTPVGANLGSPNPATVTIQEDDSAPTFSIDDVSNNEGDAGTTTYTFTVTKNGSTELSSSVFYATSDGTATTADGDYQAESGTLNFAPGDTAIQVTIDVNGDATFEPNEAFTVDLTNPVNATILDGSGTGTIVNDDNAPTFTISSVSESEGNSGITNFLFTVTKNGMSGQNSSVDFATVDGLATVADNDYEQQNGTLNFTPSQTTQTITVQVNGDTTFEPNEDFTVQLSNVMNERGEQVAGFTLPPGTGLIVNDDAASNIAVTPATSPTATDNDYTRINNAVQTIADNGTITLSGGTFDWTEPNAAASWALGSDGVAGTLDDYSILVPADLNGVTFTAANLGDATIQGPGDLPGLDLEGVFFFNVGDNQDWTISNIRFLDFDLTIGMFDAGNASAFNNTQILNNFIRMARDVATAGDVVQNIAIHYSFGANQIISGNTIDIPGDGVSAPGNPAADVAMQGNTSGGNIYDGFQITNNVIRVLNAQSANPQRIRGFWENTHAHTSNITVSGNSFTNLAAGNNPAANLQVGFRVTSHSSPTTTVAYSNNSVSGANIGFEWLSGQNFSGNDPVVLFRNTITDNGTGVLVQSQGLADLSFNRIVGNTTGLNNVDGVVTAENNWWGCNDGPNSAGCDSVIGTVDDDPWMVLRASASPNTIVPGGTSTITTDMTFNSDNVQPPGGTLPDMPVSYSATNGTVTPPTSTVVNGMASTTFTSTNGNSAVVSTTVDNQTENTPITVTAPSFAIDDVTQNEGDAGTTSFTFTVTKTGSTGLSSSVDFATQDGSATVANGDYVANSGQLVFAPGDTSMPVTVTVNGDTAFEPNETFTVNLSNPVNATISDPSGTGTILNDDATPPPPSAITVTPASTPTATDNDYTRINNAVQTIADNGTITLSGAFNWTEPFAAASWARGSDDVAGTLDDYSILVPQDLNGVTFTAANLGSASIQGPDDASTAVELEGVFFFDGSGDNQDWTISNIQFLDFELSIGMFGGAGGADSYNGTQIVNNFIRMATDTDTASDFFQNIGIHFSFGTNQLISGNAIDIPGDAVSTTPGGAADIGMQSNTSGGAIYDGLQITNNVIRVLNAQSATPEFILGIWENAYGHTSDITVSGNSFINLAAGNNPAANLQLGFEVTSHSSPTTTVTYSNNTVTGANLGFEWFPGGNYAGNLPVNLINNTLTNNATAVLVQSQGQANLTSNRIMGSGAASTGVEAYDGLTTVDMSSSTISGAGTAVLVDATNSGTDPVTMRITNSTLSGNTAVNGGALNSVGTSGNAATTITNSTLTGNSPSGTSIVLQNASLTVGNSIFNAGTTGTNISATGTSLVTSLGYNLSSDAFAGFLTATGDQTGKDPILGPLKNNGGLTFTHAPLTSSPVIDRGKDLGPVGPGYSATGVDQRGTTRPQVYNDSSIVPPAGGDLSDIGAVELADGVFPVSAASRKTHGGAGTFDIPLSLNGPVEIECRTGGPSMAYQLVATFTGPVTFSSAAVTSGTGTVVTATPSGNQVIINLTGVTNLQRLTVGLFDVSDGTNTGDVGIRVGLVLADTTGNGAVGSSDIGQTKSQAGQPVTGTNFRNDVTANGAINASDVGVVKSQSGASLPPTPAEPTNDKR